MGLGNDMSTSGAKSDRRRQAWYGIIAVGMIALLAFTPAARAVILLIPLLSFCLALYLQRWLPVYYVSFVCWQFFLIAMLRRMVEYRTGGGSATPMMISPLLCCIAGLAAYRADWSGLLDRRLRPWHLVLGVLLYSVFVGYLQNPRYAMCLDAVGWFSPICFSFYLFAKREQIAEALHSIQSSFIYGVGMMSLYGLYQYFFLAPWDAAWMINSPGLTSIGMPEAREVRLFSTMNTPQPFAGCLVVGILMCLTSKNRWRYLIVPLALLNLLLSSSRAGWLGGAIGFLFLAVTFSARQRLQLLSAVVGSIVLVWLAMQVPEINDTFSQRFDSLFNVEQDASYQDRVASQDEAIDLFKSFPFGMGMGAAGAQGQGEGPSGGVAQPDSPAMGDNGIEEVTLTFGWFGSVIFILGFGGAVALCFRRLKVPDLMPMKAILVALLCEVPIMGIFPGIDGFLIWTAIGLCAAYRFSPGANLSGSPAPASNYGPALLQEA